MQGEQLISVYAFYLVLNFLFHMPFDFAVKLGVGGFSMGAATALYSASCFTHGKFANGNAYSAHLDAVVGLSGWLPCAKFDYSLFLLYIFLIHSFQFSSK